MSNRLALIIGNSLYRDEKLTKLVAPDADVGALKDALLDPELGGFDDVSLVFNSATHIVRREIYNFFADKTSADMLLFYFSGHGVLDEHGKLCGVISEGDCLKEVVRGKYNNMPNLSGHAKDHMTTGVVTISPETNIFDATDMFLSKRIRRFPVVSEGKLVGQISQKDIMRAVLKMKSATW